MKDWVSVILAGGQSRRMGQSKALLKLDQITLLERAIHTVAPFSSGIVVLLQKEDRETVDKLNIPSHIPIHYVEDEPAYQGQGPLAGMLTAMKIQSSYWYFVIACDMVNINQSYVKGIQQYVINHSIEDDGEAYIPIQGSRYQPLAGVYRPCAKKIEALLEANQRQVQGLLNSVKIRCIQPEIWQSWTQQQEPFLNLNTPQDLQQWKRQEKDSSSTE